MVISNVTLDNLEFVAREVIDFLGDAKVLLIDAPMGSGKTTFIKELCKGMGVSETVSSPTFSIINEYQTDKKKQIVHFDLYRIKSKEEAIQAGLEDYLDRADLCIIEWPEIARELFSQYVELKISVNKDLTREFELTRGE